jgi:hypothetical protein
MDYKNFYCADNLLDWPDQLAIIKLSEPRVFVRFTYDEGYFVTFEDFFRTSP